MATPKASKASKVRNAAKTAARKDAMATLMDRLADNRAHRTTLSTREVADRYNAALMVALATDPENAPKTGPIVGFHWDGADSPVSPSDSDTMRYADLRWGHVTPVFGAE